MWGRRTGNIIISREKSDGSLRLILNLKDLKKNIENQHLKMDPITLLLKLVTL